MDEPLIKVDLGGGLTNRRAQGFTSIDIRKFPYTDYVLDIGKDRLPFEDDSVDYIEASQTFEHLYPEQLFFCVEECWRVLKPQGRLHVEVPIANTPKDLNHPDHKIRFVKDSFAFFQVPGDGIDPHGYLKHFFHVTAWEDQESSNVCADMFPNKIGCKYGYQEVELKV